MKLHELAFYKEVKKDFDSTSAEIDLIVDKVGLIDGEVINATFSRKVEKDLKLVNTERNHIKIASWNINKFESSSILEIAKVIVDENPDIIFLQEFPTDNIHKFMDKVNETSQIQYDLITQQPLYERNFNITLALVKANLKEHIDMLPMIDNMPLKLRLIELEFSINNKSINILGLHCPLSKKSDNQKRKKDINAFWDKLVDYSKSKDSILIGDFNFNFKKPNKHVRHMKQIINNGYLDLENEIEHYTYCYDTYKSRIDYALMHSSLTYLNNSNNSMLITPKYIQDTPSNEFRFSDHRMIIVEIAL